MENFINQALLKPLELLGDQVVNVLPNVLAMGIILLGGLFIAWALGVFSERLFRMIGFDHLCDRLGMNAALLRGGVKTDPSRIVGRSIYWTVMVLASIAALGALNLTPINQFAKSLLAYHVGLAFQAIRLRAEEGAQAWTVARELSEGCGTSTVIGHAGKVTMVDAAMAGFDQGELVTIPSLPDRADWEAYEAARQNMIPKLSLSSPAARYGVTAAQSAPASA